MAASTINPVDIVWGKGYLFGTISGGAVDTVLCAELTNVSLSWSQEFVELRGPSSLSPIAVGQSARALTFNAQWAKVRARQFTMAMGATASYSSPKTTLSMGVNTEPALFNLHLIANGSTAISAVTDKTFEVNLFGCVVTSMGLEVPLNNFVSMNFSGNVYGNGTNLFQMILPDDQTTS